MGTLKIGFAAELRRARKIALDTSILIYHLEDILPYSDLTETVITLIGEGTINAVLSAISVTELLVKPFTDKRADRVAELERFLAAIPNLDVIAPGYAAARQAAELRGTYHLRTPDALIFASALEEKARAFVTNDSRLRRLNSKDIKILMLDDYL